MSKVITLSRKFMQQHPRAGEETYFVEAFLNNRGVDYTTKSYFYALTALNRKNIELGKLTERNIAEFIQSLNPRILKIEKPHTIRDGSRFKKGEYASVRCWFNMPYNSPQIILTPDTEIKKVWKFVNESESKKMSINGKKISTATQEKLAFNDALTYSDFDFWFRKSFAGQIICWDEKVKY